MQNEKYTLKKLIKKIKSHARLELLPLYRQQATYLLRVIKTVNIQSIILNQIETFISVATCHEVAINQNSELSLETHQNSRGVEAEYTVHHKAKNVSRNLRVRIIWSIIKEELENDMDLENFEEYESLAQIYEVIRCPICKDVIYKQEERWVGTHDDGTENFSIEWEFQDYCEHLILETADSQDAYYTGLESEIENLVSYGFEYTNVDVIETVAKKLKQKVEIESVGEGQYMNYLYFVEDRDDIEEQILEEIKNYCDECDELKTECEC